MTFDLAAWLRRDALPLWAESGVDAAGGSFIERLDLDARPLPDAPRRVMVQARQIFVFAEAEARGWYRGGMLAERAGEAMVRSYRCEDGGWIFSVSADGRPVDETRDFYAQAFVIFALAKLARLTGSRRWLALADATLSFLDERMATPTTGGYREALPAAPGRRRQNPHMHLLEALLALDELSPGGSYRRRAAALVDLLHRRFLHGAAPALVEFYDDGLRPLSDAPFAFEPGHHFEWAWLLSRDAALAGAPPPPLAGVLFESGLLGLTPEGVFRDEVDETGAVRVASTRLWPCTEAIRAATLPLGGQAPSTMVASLAAAMNERFLKPAPAGCWIDHTAADGSALSTSVPASSLYHIVGAVTALA